METRTIRALDLFCGAGGLTCGLLQSGIDVVAGIDVEKSCKYAYEHNNKARFINADVSELTRTDLKSFLPKRGNYLTLLAGGVPCQTFSSANFSKSITERKGDIRWNLILEFARLIECYEPNFVVLENVPGLVGQDVFFEFRTRLLNRGYYVSHYVINASDYGVPQRRRRLIVLASKLYEIKLLSSEQFGSKKATVRDAIGYLPLLRAGETDLSDQLHKSASLSELNLRRIRASKPGGTWREWDDELKANCHKRVSGQTFGSVYGRMSWDEPSPTLTTWFNNYGCGRFGHPEQDRALSLREGALLQTFPLDYEFFERGSKISVKKVLTMIGNAVPPKLGELIGKSVISSLKSRKG